MGTGIAWVALTNVLGCEPAERKAQRTRHPSSAGPTTSGRPFHSRPDLSPPTVDVTTQAHDTAPGYIFVAPKQRGTRQGGSMICNDRGQLVWFRPMQDAHMRAMDLKVQHYQGRPVLTFTERRIFNEYVILDSSYQELSRVRAGNGYHGDHHEFLITPQDTALLTIYNPVRRDLSPVGGPEDAAVVDGIAQEVNVETGEVLFEWHSLDHVGLEESFSRSEDQPGHFDYFHINSIDIDHDDNLLVSARQTSAVYKIDRESGEIIWRLGGKKSDFEMGPGTPFAYQHDARRQPDGTITIFDNGTTTFDNGRPKGVEESRGIVLDIDEEELTAALVREYTHPDKQSADASGNMQMLPNGNVFIGWGRAMDFSEFSRDGELLFSASLPPKNLSYRAFRFPWSGHPSDQPAAVAERTSEDKVDVHASWNGATEVAIWQVLAGPNCDQMKPVGSAARDGFETTITAHSSGPYVAVQAKDRLGRVLGTSQCEKALAFTP